MTPRVTPEEARALGGLEALIADDDGEIRDLLADFLSQRGLRVATAIDGRAAVAALERSGGRFRLVLADLAMPGADGLAVLQAARAANPSAYVVIITGYASLDSAVEAVRLGANDYIAKPFSLGQIDVILQHASARRALELEARRLADRGIVAALASIDDRLGAIERELGALSARLARAGHAAER